MYPLTEDISAVFARFTPGEPVLRLAGDSLTMQHATWFNNDNQKAVSVCPGEWQERIMTCYLKTSVPVELSGVTWLYGKPVMVAGCTYVIALQQIDAATVLANLAYTVKQ